MRHLTFVAQKAFTAGGLGSRLFYGDHGCARRRGVVSLPGIAAVSAVPRSAAAARPAGCFACERRPSTVCASASVPRPCSNAPPRPAAIGPLHDAPGEAI